jgi:hypothetical protein
MLTRSMKITLDSKSCELKIMMQLQVAGKRCRGYFRESDAPGSIRECSRMSAHCASGYQTQVPVDKRNLCRLDYRVAEAITLFCAKRIHTGDSFPPNVRASSPLASPKAMPTEWFCRSLSPQMQWFSDIRDSNTVESVIQMIAEMNQ